MSKHTEEFHKDIIPKDEIIKEIPSFNDSETISDILRTRSNNENKSKEKSEENKEDSIYLIEKVNKLTQLLSKIVSKNITTATPKKKCYFKTIIKIFKCIQAKSRKRKNRICS